MTDQGLIERLAELPDVESQERFLTQHAPQLDDEAAQALKRQADHFLRADIGSSLATAKLLLYMAELTSNPLHRALGLLAEANARSIGLGDYQRGLELYDEAAGIYQAEGRMVEQARSQIGKLVALSRMGRYDEALETGRWAGRVLGEHAQWRPLADLTLNLGVIHSRLGQDAESLAQYDRARELYTRLGPEGEAFLPWVEHDRAVALRNLGQFEASLQAAEGAEEMLTRLGQRVEAARAQQLRALTFYVLGRYNEALDLYDRVRDVFLADGRQRDAILADLFITDCLLQLRRFSDVLAKCRRIREGFTELGTHYEAAQALLNEAVAYAGLDQHEEAMASLSDARRMFVHEGNEVWVAITDLDQASLLSRQGCFEESLTAAQTCADIFEGYGLPIHSARALLTAAWAAAALNRHDRARQLAAETLIVAENQDIPSLNYQTHHLLGTLAAAEGNPTQAMAEYDHAIPELERLRGRLMVEFRADFLEDKMSVYEDAVLLLLDAGRPARALEYAERAKSQALLDLLTYRLDLRVRARRPEDRPLVEQLGQLRSERDRLYRRWAVYGETGEEEWASVEEARQEARRDVLALEKQITDLWYRILIRNADYARDASLWQVRAEPVQPFLSRDTLLLEFFVAQEQLLVFLVTSNSVQVRRLPCDLGQLQHLVQLLWLNLRTVPTMTDRVAGLARNARGILQKLYQSLVAPLLAEMAPYTKLIVVPHGLLHYLPFHALHDGEAHLVERYEVSYLPVAGLLRYCRESGRAASGSLVLGHSYGGLLPGAVQEAHSIASILGAQALVQDEATRACIQESAADLRVIHLAAHGEFRPDNPLFSGLALADGWLTTLDIFDLQLRASLVTLSACQTGQNVVSGGDELQGLMRAILYAGASSVVLSLWTVEDRSTAHLMQEFYQRLSQGEPKGAALRHAQRRLMASADEGTAETAGRYAHPYFWAPFFLVGDAGVL